MDDRHFNDLKSNLRMNQESPVLRRGECQTIFMIAALVVGFLSPLPCLIVSIFGTVFASKAKKEGVAGAKKYFILGIIEIVVCAVGTFLSIVMYIIGQGV